MVWKSSDGKIHAQALARRLSLRDDVLSVADLRMVNVNIQEFK